MYRNHVYDITYSLPLRSRSRTWNIRFYSARQWCMQAAATAIDMHRNAARVLAVPHQHTSISLFRIIIIQSPCNRMPNAPMLCGWPGDVRWQRWMASGKKLTAIASKIVETVKYTLHSIITCRKHSFPAAILCELIHVWVESTFLRVC